MRVAMAFGPILCLTLAGCSLDSTAPATPLTGSSIRGNVHGGQQPVVGAHVYLLAANTTGYGNASLSLLNAASTGLADSVGAYVLTGGDGGFTISRDYTCTAGTQVYVYAVGGNPGAGTNAAAGFLAILGQCPALGNFSVKTPYIWVNEVSTVAAAYAFAGFATDATHVSSSGTALAQIGIANAFANAANLASLSTGVALSVTPAGNGLVPQGTIYTLADILASCVNSTGTVAGPSDPTTCYTLFSNATADGTASGAVPSDTASAAINIAHHPGVNVGNLYALQTPNPPFAGSLTGQPNDFTIALAYTGGGLRSPQRLAIDGQGDAWIADAGNGASRVVELSPAGAAISPASGFTGGGLYSATAIAVDTAGFVWVANTGSSFQTVVAEFSSSGTAVSSASGYSGGPSASSPAGLALDGSGNVWIANNENVSELSSAGALLSPAGGYTGGGIDQPQGIALDGASNVWVSNAFNVSELSDSGAGLSPASGYSPGAHCYCAGIALDHAGSAWVVNESTALVKLSSSGALLSPSAGYTGGGLTAPRGVAIDGGGDAWVANNGSISEFSNSGAALSPATGFIGPFASQDYTPGPYTVAVDGSGDVWVVTNLQPVLEFVGAATPVVTPLAAGVANNRLGTRP